MKPLLPLGAGQILSTPPRSIGQRLKSIGQATPISWPDASLLLARPSLPLANPLWLLLPLASAERGKSLHCQYDYDIL